MRTLRIAAAVAVGLVAMGAGLAATAGGPPPAVDGGNAEDLLERADASITQIQEALRQGTERLDAAKQAKDIVRVNCINRKVRSIRGLLQIAEMAAQAMREPASGDDAKGRTHNFTKIDLAKSKAEGFRALIETCAGEQSQYTGETTVDTQIEGDMRDGDPAEDEVLAGEPIDTDRPSSATLDY